MELPEKNGAETLPAGVTEGTPPTGAEVVAEIPVVAELLVAVVELAVSGAAAVRELPPVAVEFITCVPVVAAVVLPCICSV